MSVGFQAVQWNRFKIIYDLVLWAGAIALMTVFIVDDQRDPAGGRELPSGPAGPARLWTDGVIVLLFITLAIGPLARLSDRFKPLLYNRRHMGVTVFFFGADPRRPGADVVSRLFRNECLRLASGDQSQL
jgi:sulfoxide reductase heme-binding subunit YedZ